MANITKKITLTEKNDAGPLFDFYWSVDNITYTSSEDSRNLYLPYVGASTVVTIDDTATAFKLESKGACTNSVLSGSFGPTPTPTSTPTPTPTPTTIVYDNLRVYLDATDTSSWAPTDPTSWYNLMDLTESASLSNFSASNEGYNSLYFDGTTNSGSLILCSTTPNTVGDVSIEMWVIHKSGSLSNPTGNNWDVLLTEVSSYCGSSGASDGILGLLRSGTNTSFEANFYPDSAALEKSVSTTNSLGIFEHYVLTWNGSDAGNEKLKLYKNGSFIGEDAWNNLNRLPLYTLDPGNLIAIAQYKNTGADLQNIEIGKIRVYNKELSLSEIQQNYNYESADFPSITPTPTPTPSPSPTPFAGPTPTPTPTVTPVMGTFGSHDIQKVSSTEHRSVWNGSSNMFNARSLVSYLTGQASPSTSTPYSLSHINYKIYDSTNVERASFTNAGTGTAMYYFDGVQSVVRVDGISTSGTYLNGSSSSTDIWQYSKL